MGWAALALANDVIFLLLLTKIRCRRVDSAAKIVWDASCIRAACGSGLGSVHLMSCLIPDWSFLALGLNCTFSFHAMPEISSS